MGLLTPVVIEQDHRGERSYDIWSRLLKDRIIFLGSEINDMVATPSWRNCCFSTVRTQNRIFTSTSIAPVV